MKIGDEVYVHGYIDEIRNDVIIIRNDGGYFGTAPSEVVNQEPKRGKWLNHSEDGYVECPFCHSATNCDDNIEELNFCFSCGADMRGERMIDLIDRQAVIDGLEYEAELCKRVLDNMDVDRKERDRFEWELELVECFIEDIKELPSKEIINTKSVFNLSEDVISRQTAIEAIHEYSTSGELFYRENHEVVSVGVIEKTLLELPSAQLEIITCKDCKHLQKWRSEESAKKFGQIYVCARNVFNCPKPEDFCSFAERRVE